MHKPTLLIRQKGDVIYLNVQCCLEHSWITSGVMIAIENGCSAALRVDITTVEMTVDEGMLLAQTLVFLSSVGDAINNNLSHKSIGDIQQLFSHQTIIEGDLSCQETSALH